jgi:hypothetical protein
VYFLDVETRGGAGGTLRAATPRLSRRPGSASPQGQVLGVGSDG